MANNFSAGDLSLSIGAIADDTLKKLDILEQRLSFIEGSLKRISGNARTAVNGTSGKGGNSKKQSSDSFGKGLLNIGKWTMVVASARRLGRFVGNVVQAGSDYTETLNLWQVAMRNNLDIADEFINKMQKAYGISSKTLMNAQATFKNMIGSLGQISDATAYALSEALVQMSADFASLYNVTIQSAFDKMQSMLAGQVRPIRSAGLDMTETTLFMFYQQLGGTKTMRQLNRTEKQLLSILAVYKQMGSAGALGDMSKTLNQFANQSRMMTEYWAELKTWSGLLLKDLIDQSGLLVHINALLITATEIVKAIAQSRGLGEENFLTGMFETAEATNDEIDELQGKLLDFDKFRSLEGAQTSELAIDEKLLDAISGYSSQIDQAKNAAQELAKSWLSILGFTEGANGEFTITEENLQNIKNTLSGILIIVGSLIGLGILASLVKLGTGIYTYAIKPLGSLVIGLGKGIIAIYKFNEHSQLMNVALSHTSRAVFSFTAGLIGMSAAIVGAFLLFQNWGDMSTWQKVIGIVGVATTAILGLAMAFGVFHAAWSMGLATAGIAAGIAMIVGSIASVKKDIEQPIQYAAVGASNIDGGTLFVAGEMGKTEAVYTGSNGKTNVANIQQMKTAYTQSLNEWWSHAKHDIPAFQSVSDSGIYTIVDGEARRRGKKFANR